MSGARNTHFNRTKPTSIPQRVRSVIKLVLSLAGVFLLLFLTVELIGTLALFLGETSPEEFAESQTITVPQRGNRGAEALNGVAEWPAERGRSFRQAPYWDAWVVGAAFPPLRSAYRRIRSSSCPRSRTGSTAGP